MIEDPRPDLAEDHALWTRLLAVAGDGELAWTLHGFRCLGRRLRWQAGRALLGRADDEPAEEYAAHRAQYLVPHTGALVALLGSLSKEVSIE